MKNTKKYFFMLILGVIASANADFPYKYLTLPHPPVSREDTRGVSQDFLAFNASKAKEAFSKLDSSANCPRTNRLVRKIYNRVVKANHIDRFFDLEQIQMQIIVLCPAGMGVNAMAQTGSLVVSAPYIRLFMKTEDELALLLSHEISHILQGSDIKALQNRILYDQFYSTDEEIKADQNALAMVANAGFDARTSIGFMGRVSKGLPTDAAMEFNTHMAPALRSSYAQMMIETLRLPKAIPTRFDTDALLAFMLEVQPDQADLKYAEQ